MVVLFMKTAGGNCSGCACDAGSVGLHCKTFLKLTNWIELDTFSQLYPATGFRLPFSNPILQPFCFPRRLVLSCSRLPMENQSSLRPKVERAADLTSMPPNANKLDKKTFRCSKQDAHNCNTSSRSALLLSGNGYVSFGLAITE